MLSASDGIPPSAMSSILADRACAFRSCRSPEVEYGKGFRLGKHLFLFLLDVVAHAFRKNRELGFAMIAVPRRAVELRDQNLGDMVLLIGFVHELRAHVLGRSSDRRSLFENGVIWKSAERLAIDLLSQHAAGV